MAEISILMSGANSCNMHCQYCGAHKKCSKVKINPDLLIRKLTTNPIVKDCLEKGKELMFNFWGGEPLLKLDVIWYLKTLLEKNFPSKQLKYFISTNGVNIQETEVLDFIHKIPNLRLQLSHDGVGQFVRSGEDILLNRKRSDAIVSLVREGKLDLINTVLNKKNPSFYANMFYWNRWRYDNHIENVDLGIKLNHIGDDGFTPELNLTGEELKLYMHELELLMITVYSGNYDKVLWAPYVSYIKNQAERDNLFKGHGGCARFAVGEVDYSWVITTTGEYTACQLWDTNEGMPNIKMKQPAYCKGCEFEHYNECNKCPAHDYAPKCEYMKEYMRLMMRMRLYRAILGNKNSECSCQQPKQ